MKVLPKAALVAATLASPVAHAAGLTEVEKAYIWMDVATTIAKASCGAHEIPGGMFKMGERNGIDVELFGRAIIAAASAAVVPAVDLQDQRASRFDERIDEVVVLDRRSIREVHGDQVRAES